MICLKNKAYLFLICQSCLKELDKEILCPPVVVWKTGGHFLSGDVSRGQTSGQQENVLNVLLVNSHALTHVVPVKTKAETVQLVTHGLNVTEDDANRGKLKTDNECSHLHEICFTFLSNPLGQDLSLWLHSLLEVQRHPNPSDLKPTDYTKNNSIKH